MTPFTSRRVVLSSVFCVCVAVLAGAAHAQTASAPNPNPVTGTNPCPKNIACTTTPNLLPDTGTSGASPTTSTSSAAIQALMMLLGLS